MIRIAQGHYREPNYGTFTIDVKFDGISWSWSTRLAHRDGFATKRETEADARKWVDDYCAKAWSDRSMPIHNQG